MPSVDAGVREWADYVFIENNTKGLVREWWIHLPTSYWFIAESDTATNDVVRTYPADELYAEHKEIERND